MLYAISMLLMPSTMILLKRSTPSVMRNCYTSWLLIARDLFNCQTRSLFESNSKRFEVADVCVSFDEGVPLLSFGLGRLSEQTFMLQLLIAIPIKFQHNIAPSCINFIGAKNTLNIYDCVARR